MRAFVLVVLMTTASCAPLWRPSRGPSSIQFERHVRLHGHDLTVHLTAGQPHGAPLIVYATGDAGWWGKDKAIFSTLMTWGYPVAGVSAREYIRHLGPGEATLRPAEIAADVVAIVSTAETALGLPASTPVVLVGKSRGAGLAVAAGSVSHLGGRLLGILAIGLTREEEYVTVRPSDARGSATRAPLDTYASLPALGATPIAVIQSTHDEYVPAGEARELFGPDTVSRRLSPIDSGNHNFSGALPALYQEMEQSFEWIVQR